MKPAKEDQNQKLGIRNAIYIAVGLFVFFSTLCRLWQEGVFGNAPTRLFLFLVGPKIGFTKLFSLLFLILGESLEFYKTKYAIIASTISFICAEISLVFICHEAWIWSTMIDTILFTFLLVLFYVPVFIGKRRMIKKNNKYKPVI